jgi:acetylornithine/N-succinyldiaminopimelate aminotransferase
VITLTKSLGGGLPIGALVTSPALADVYQPGDHGSTFAGGPLVTAAANSVLDVLDDEDLLANVRRLGERLAAGLRELPGVREVRQRGLMVAFDVDGAPELVKRALLEQRLVLNATGPDTVRMLPALIVSDAECDDALSRVGASLAAA